MTLLTRWETCANAISLLSSRGLNQQFLVENVLCWMYSPLAESIRWRLRRSRAAEISVYVWSCSKNSRLDQTFWRLQRNNSRFSLKFGTDWPLTLAYLDVFDHMKSLQNWVVKHVLPMVLAPSGDGGYTAPYHLEYEDPFTQSVSQYVGKRSWQQVLLSFNTFARLLPPNPSDLDTAKLCSSVRRVSERVLQQTDLECHAVLFEALMAQTPSEPSRRLALVLTHR